MDTNINGIIYKISFPNGKNYIGLTKRVIKKRQGEHKCDSKSGNTRCLYNALRKYKDNLEMAFCEVIDTASSSEELCEKEKMYIQKYNSYYIHGNGYNMTYGGEGTHGYIFTEEDKKNMSKSQKKRFENLEEREKLALQSRNYWNENEEAKEKMRQLKNEQCTEEWREKQSETLKNTYKNNPELSKQHSKRMKQMFIDNPELTKQHSKRMKQVFIDNPELAKQHSKKMKQLFIDNPEQRIKNGEAQKQRFERPEEKEKLSKIHKQRFQDNPNAKINKNMSCKPFNVYDKKTNKLIGSYNYMFQAVDDIKTKFNIILYTTNISKLLNGKGKTAKGLIFKYADNNVSENIDNVSENII